MHFYSANDVMESPNYNKMRRKIYNIIVALI